VHDLTSQLLGALCDGNVVRARDLVAIGATLTDNQIVTFLQKCSKVTVSYNFLVQEYPFEAQHLAELVLDLCRDARPKVQPPGVGNAVRPPPPPCPITSLLSFRADVLRQKCALNLLEKVFEEQPASVPAVKRFKFGAQKLLRPLFGPTSTALPRSVLAFDFEQAIAADSSADTATLARMVPKITAFRIDALFSNKTSRVTIEAVIDNHHHRYNEDDLGSLLFAAWNKSNVVNYILAESRPTCPKIQAHLFELCFHSLNPGFPMNPREARNELEAKEKSAFERFRKVLRCAALQRKPGTSRRIALLRVDRRGAPPSIKFPGKVESASVCNHSTPL
jgi:hypothetical protein